MRLNILSVWGPHQGNAPAMRDIQFPWGVGTANEVALADRTYRVVAGISAYGAFPGPVLMPVHG
jgi:hypothetical protein